MALWLLALGALLPIAFMAQSMNDFQYATTDYPAGARAGVDRDFIQQEFGRALPMALLAPLAQAVLSQRKIVIISMFHSPARGRTAR